MHSSSKRGWPLLIGVPRYPLTLPSCADCHGSTLSNPVSGNASGSGATGGAGGGCHLCCCCSPGPSLIVGMRRHACMLSMPCGLPAPLCRRRRKWRGGWQRIQWCANSTLPGFKERCMSGVRPALVLPVGSHLPSLPWLHRRLIGARCGKALRCQQQRAALLPARLPPTPRQLGSCCELLSPHLCLHALHLHTNARSSSSMAPWQVLQAHRHRCIAQLPVATWGTPSCIKPTLHRVAETPLWGRAASSTPRTTVPASSVWRFLPMHPASMHLHHSFRSLLPCLVPTTCHAQRAACAASPRLLPSGGGQGSLPPRTHPFLVWFAQRID